MVRNFLGFFIWENLHFSLVEGYFCQVIVFLIDSFNVFSTLNILSHVLFATRFRLRNPLIILQELSSTQKASGFFSPAFKMQFLSVIHISLIIMCLCVAIFPLIILRIR